MAEEALDRRVAVITGAAQGLGVEIALRLAGDGYALALLDLREDGLRNTAERVRRDTGGAEVLTIAVDLSDEEQVGRAFGRIDAEFGGVDALVNTAGGSGTDPVRDIGELSPTTWRRVLDNNVTSAFLCAQHAVPLMRRRGNGRIVNFSSAVANGLAGPSGTVGARLAYATSKGAVNSFTKQLAKDLAGSGITVNAVSPGLVLPTAGRVRTVFESLSDADQAAIQAAIPMGRPGTGAEIAAAVAYLVSDDAGFTSGAILSVDGAAS